MIALTKKESMAVANRIGLDRANKRRHVLANLSARQSQLMDRRDYRSALIHRTEHSRHNGRKREIAEKLSIVESQIKELRG